MKKSLKDTAIKHLKGDMKGYRTERAYLKKEISEDKELMGKLRKSETSPKKGSTMKRQTKKDREDERKGEKDRKEAAAGRKYNRSEKHREAESRGMKKAMKKK